MASDGSTDRTNEIVEATGGDEVLLLRLSRGGKVAALNASVGLAVQEFVRFQLTVTLRMTTTLH